MRPRQLLSISSFSKAMQSSVRKSKLRLLTGGLCRRITATPTERQRQESFDVLGRTNICDGSQNLWHSAGNSSEKMPLLKH